MGSEMCIRDRSYEDRFDRDANFRHDQKTVGRWRSWATDFQTRFAAGAEFDESELASRPGTTLNWSLPPWRQAQERLRVAGLELPPAKSIAGKEPRSKEMAKACVPEEKRPRQETWGEPRSSKASSSWGGIPSWKGAAQWTAAQWAAWEAGSAEGKRTEEGPQHHDWERALWAFLLALLILLAVRGTVAVACDLYRRCKLRRAKTVTWASMARERKTRELVLMRRPRPMPKPKARHSGASSSSGWHPPGGAAARAAAASSGLGFATASEVAEKLQAIEGNLWQQHWVQCLMIALTALTCVEILRCILRGTSNVPTAEQTEAAARWAGVRETLRERERERNLAAVRRRLQEQLLPTSTATSTSSVNTAALEALRDEEARNYPPYCFDADRDFDNTVSLQAEEIPDEEFEPADSGSSSSRASLPLPPTRPLPPSIIQTALDEGWRPSGSRRRDNLYFRVRHGM